jgi:glucosamine-6-phosphate deaminase
MQVVVYSTADEASDAAGALVADLVRANPHAVLGLAAGDTPRRLYRDLARRRREGLLDLSRVSTFNLDEYVGLPATHPASFHHVMDEVLFSHVNVPRAHIHIPDGTAKDLEAECTRYEASIRDAGGIDLLILGLGANGHIGFNEPGTPFDSRTRVETLAEETRRANAEAFGDAGSVPARAITMGLSTILDARAIVIMAFGERKADAVAKMIEGPVTPEVPASVLQRHPHVTGLFDGGSVSFAKRD